VSRSSSKEPGKDGTLSAFNFLEPLASDHHSTFIHGRLNGKDTFTVQVNPEWKSIIMYLDEDVLSTVAKPSQIADRTIGHHDNRSH
jgi:hypothetical protein